MKIQITKLTRSIPALSILAQVPLDFEDGMMLARLIKTANSELENQQKLAKTIADNHRNKREVPEGKIPSADVIAEINAEIDIKINSSPAEIDLANTHTIPLSRIREAMGSSGNRMPAAVYIDLEWLISENGDKPDAIRDQ